MAILGSIIKRAIDLSDSFSSESSPVEEQKKVLKILLETAKDTAFGKYHGFKKILNSDTLEQAYAEAIPFHDYNKMKHDWWDRVIDGLEDITWPGKPSYFALSSGTTGKTPTGTH